MEETLQAALEMWQEEARQLEQDYNSAKKRAQELNQENFRLKAEIADLKAKLFELMNK